MQQINADGKFWSKVDKTGNNGKVSWNGTPCWLWTAAVSNHGYGKAASGKRSIWCPAHRKAWELTHGPIPEGKKVLHHCDNPPCVNDKHLFLGTMKDNSRDMAAKFRGGNQKIHPSEIPVILHCVAVGIRMTDIAKMYGVTCGAIWFIVEKAEGRYKRAG